MTQVSHTGPKADVYTRVTERIVEDLAAGVRPWMKPWSSARAVRGLGAVTRPLRHNGAPYRGVNVLLLWGEAQARGFTSSTWMTYRQAQEIGAQVRKGEAGSLVVYADRYIPKSAKSETNERGEQAEREVAFLKGYTVFNVEQIEGLPAKYIEPAEPAAATCGPVAMHEAAEAFFAATGAKFCYGGDRAFYALSRDFIQLPVREVFRDAESFAATKSHELIHWAGAATRNAREFGVRFGDRAYAFEELVAELGAAFLCADLGITPEVREDHAAYLACWLEVLKDDKRAIFSAAAHAQRAVDYLQALQCASPVEPLAA